MVNFAIMAACVFVAFGIVPVATAISIYGKGTYGVGVYGENTVPVIDAFQPADTTPSPALQENVTFNLTFHDPDLEPVNLSWFVDGVFNTSDSNFSYQFITAGTFNITGYVNDSRAHAEQTWTVSAGQVAAPAGGGGGVPQPIADLIEAIESLWNLRRGAIGVYDVAVDVEKAVYNPGDMVSATITLRNILDIPDKDAILKYYLTGPESDTVISLSQEQLIEIPPIDFSENACKLYGGELDSNSNCVTFLQRSILVPANGVRGEWRFNVEYDTARQSTIKVFDVFSVMRNFDMLIGLGLVSLFVFREYKRKTDKTRPRRRRR